MYYNLVRPDLIVSNVREKSNRNALMSDIMKTIQLLVILLVIAFVIVMFLVGLGVILEKTSALSDLKRLASLQTSVGHHTNSNSK